MLIYKPGSIVLSMQVPDTNYVFYSFNSAWNIAFSHAKSFLQATLKPSCWLTPGATEYSVFPASPPQHAGAALPSSCPLTPGTHGNSWMVKPRQPIAVQGKVSSSGATLESGELRNVNLIPARLKTAFIIDINRKTSNFKKNSELSVCVKHTNNHFHHKNWVFPLHKVTWSGDQQCQHPWELFTTPRV